MAQVRVLIPTGYGENCSIEAADAYRLAGAVPQIAHISDILSGQVDMHSFHIFNWGGGFLDGDDLGSAKAGANRLKWARVQRSGKTFMEELVRFRDDGKLIAGQCNGFQLWVKAGILPGIDGVNQELTLSSNASGKFEDRWVHLAINKKSPCVWTKGIKSMFLPVRHGEGRLMVEESEKGESILREMKKLNLIAAQYATDKGVVAKTYPQNPNGSIESIAGLCDKTGRVFALMPHPEAFVRIYTHPYWTRLKAQYERAGKKLPEWGDGLAVFRNAVEYIKDEVL